jgi:hypothetical protein
LNLKAGPKNGRKSVGLSDVDRLTDLRTFDTELVVVLTIHSSAKFHVIFQDPKSFPRDHGNA